MLKEIHGQCTYDNAKLFKALEKRFAVTFNIEPGGSASQTIFTIAETTEGAIGAALFRDMKALLDYAALLEQLEIKENQLSQATTDQKVVTEKNTIVKPAEVSYLLALWGLITAQLSSIATTFK